MLAEIKTGFGILNGTRNLIDRWRNLPLIEAQVTEIAALKSQIALLQEANSVIHQQNLTLQKTVSTQQSRIRELEEEKMKLENWKIEAERYELVELPPATYVYRIKEDAQDGEPSHYICPHCYNHSVKSILQYLRQSRGQKSLYVRPVTAFLKQESRNPIAAQKWR